MNSNKSKKIKQKLASLCIKSGYQPGFTLRVSRNVNTIKGPPQVRKISSVRKLWKGLRKSCESSAPGLLECSSTGGPSSLSPAATLRTRHRHSSQVHSEHAATNLERWLCSKLLCCEHLRMSIKLMSFKRPISITEKEKKKKAKSKAFGYISPFWKTFQLLSSHWVWNGVISSLSGEWL